MSVPVVLHGGEAQGFALLLSQFSRRLPLYRHHEGGQSTLEGAQPEKNQHYIEIATYYRNETEFSFLGHPSAL